jgi:hypothetical protein
VTERFSSGRHSRDHPEISITDGNIEVFRNGASPGNLFLLIPILVFVVALEGVGLCVVGGIAYSAANDLDALHVFMMFVFGVPTMGVIWPIVAVQRLIFPFRLTVSRQNYVLRNGLIRVTRHLDPKDSEIVFRPSFRRGTWGFSANIRLRPGGFRWPFFPGGVWSTKREAAVQASMLSDWLEPRVPEIRLTMSEGWGDIWAHKRE